MKEYRIIINLNGSEALEVLNGGDYSFSNDEVFLLSSMTKGDFVKCGYCGSVLIEMTKDKKCPYCQIGLLE